MADPTAPLTIAMMLESDGPGGAENVVFDLSEALRERGHVVYPIGPHHGNGWLGEKLRDAGFETHTFNLTRNFDWPCLRELTATCRKLGVHVVHGHEFDGALYGAAASRLAGAAHVTTLHGNQTMTDAWKRRAALRLAFRMSQAVTAVSLATKTQLDRDLGLSSDVISVVHNGVPVRAGRPEPIRAELGVADGEVLILAVGNLLERKGHIFLLRALQALEEKGLAVPWRLAIAAGGGGDERPKLEAFAAEHGLADRLHILSYRGDVPDLLAAADLFVMPSLWEGLPLAMLEAMLMGVAVIASETSGIPEAIVSERDGLLVPPGDVGQLAGALQRLIEDASRREEIAEGGRARALAEFTVDAMAGAYEKLYRSACQKRGIRTG